MTQRCTLYRFFDENDRLLYVGISISPLVRLGQHRINKQWWPDIRRAEFEHFPSETAALEAETKAIVDENPVHNIAVKQPFAHSHWRILPPWEYNSSAEPEWVRLSVGAEMINIAEDTFLRRSKIGKAPKVVRDENGRRICDLNEVKAYKLFITDVRNNYIKAQLTG